MRGPGRIAAGALTDAACSVGFSFDGRSMRGLAGDTLASALLANGQRIVGRSFKYHRPRGIVSAGPEEPCALVDVIVDHGREPNRPATTLPLHEGLAALSQNRWPALAFDLLVVNDLFGRFLPAGFYYKTFMAPSGAWERVFEPMIRRAAGLGRLAAIVPECAMPAETVHDHTDVLIVGSGGAGLAAAQRLGANGLRVLLAEQDVVAGGSLLLDTRWQPWRETTLAALARMSTVQCLTRTTVLGAYGHGVFAALETLTPAESARCGGLAERLRVIRARRVLLACGATERLIAFPGNDRPGVMLAGAALAFLRRYGVTVGRRPVCFVNNDEAYETVHALHGAGVECAGVVDARGGTAAAGRVRALGIAMHERSLVTAVSGRGGVRRVQIVGRDDGQRRELAADCLLMSGGHTPATALASQLGAALRWQETIAAFVPDLDRRLGAVVGAARGQFGIAAAVLDGDEAAATIARELAAPATAATSLPLPGIVELPADPDRAAIEPLWEVAGSGKAFVDLQHDVTADDVRLAVREGYEHVEHMKRYTTHGMATDQGRIGGLVGSAVLAQARGLPVAAVGQANPRPFIQSIPFAALAGAESGAHFKPKRRLPLHDWHAAAGASFVNTGLWLRPLVYARQAGWEPVLEEARAVRRTAGITDVSSLGKIDVQGPDAARFLDFIYANTFSTLAVGRARYGLMLRDDGMMLDDGTTSRLAAEHFVVTTTTANAAAVLEHMEFHLQASCRGYDVQLSDVGDHWAQFALAGPRARDIAAAVVSGCDLGNEAFPFMAAGVAQIAGCAGRIFRISFSGELAYELAVPAHCAQDVWSALLQAGRSQGLKAYGLDALNSLRIEKGHVTGAELNGNTSADDLGYQRLLKKQGDYIGRALAQRPVADAATRLQLVGLRPVRQEQRLRNGAQLVSSVARNGSLGYVTSSTPGVELAGWVGLALLAGGRQRVGQRLIARSPVHEEDTEVEIVSPHMLDPENRRVRA